jgi:glycosyltransferase involved in cell wall biosynthesis
VKSRPKAKEHSGLAVVIPGRHEAVERIAAVLEQTRLLSAMYVPANLTRPWQFARTIFGAEWVPAKWLGKWAYRTPAHTSALLVEGISASALRVPGLGRGRRQALVSWRNHRTDEGAERDVARGRAGGALTVIGWPSPSFTACRRMALPAFVYANMDIWAVNRSLVREARALPGRTQHREPLLERDLSFEENATSAIVRATHLIVETRGMAQRIEELSGGDRPTVVLGHGVDLPARLPVRDSLRRRLRVLSVARVGYAKGIQYLGDAVRVAGEHVESASVAGGGLEDFPLLRRRCSALEFVGHQSRSNLNSLYAGADVFVLPTLADAMARTVLEAMASGLPVIITPESGYEGIIHDGVQGFFVPARDSHAIADKLAILARDGELRLRMGRAARELANAYSWEAFDEGVRTRLVPVVAEALRGRHLNVAEPGASIARARRSDPNYVACDEPGRRRP